MFSRRKAAALVLFVKNRESAVAVFIMRRFSSALVTIPIRIRSASACCFLHQKFSLKGFTRHTQMGPCQLCSTLSQERTMFTSSVCLKKEEKEKPKSRNVHFKDKKVIDVWRNMTVKELAVSLEKDLDSVYEAMLFVENSELYDSDDSQIYDMTVIMDIVKRFGMRSKVVSSPAQRHSRQQSIASLDKDAYPRAPPSDSSLLLLQKRPPVVTIMGHVDHGKTTLLDALRDSAIVEGEFGGITQHIGAFSVSLPNSGGASVTFLDTPGHAAFKAMRARGANATDIVVLVVAADDGVMEQTRESIRFANEARVPILVAINKIDKKEADVKRTKEMLAQEGIHLEDFGGDVQAIEISALKKMNLDNLTDAILAQAEIMQLRADQKGLAEGVIIEAKTDVHRGKLVSCVCQHGILRRGSYLVAGTAWAKVRGMFNDRGQPMQKALPSDAVEVIGWRELPSAGDIMLEVESERRAKEVVSYRESLRKASKAEQDLVIIEAKLQEHEKVYKPYLEEKRKSERKFGRMLDGEVRGRRKKEALELHAGPRLPLIIKGDVDGSVDAILDLLDTYHSHSDCRLDLIHYGVGNVTESDIELASAFNGLIYAFNVETPQDQKRLAAKLKVQIKHMNIIYRLIEDLKTELTKRIIAKDVEEVFGEAEVLQEFMVSEKNKKVPVAGCRCVKGSLKKAQQFKLIRNNADVLFTGGVSSLRHLKDEVESVNKGVECGVMLTDKSVRYEIGDRLVCFHLVKQSQETDWDPGF